MQREHLESEKKKLEEKKVKDDAKMEADRLKREKQIEDERIRKEKQIEVRCCCVTLCEIIVFTFFFCFLS